MRPVSFDFDSEGNCDSLSRVDFVVNDFDPKVEWSAAFKKIFKETRAAHPVFRSMGKDDKAALVGYIQNITIFEGSHIPEELRYYIRHRKPVIFGKSLPVMPGTVGKVNILFAEHYQKYMLSGLMEGLDFEVVPVVEPLPHFMLVPCPGYPASKAEPKPAKCKFCGYKDPAGDQGQKCPNCDEENAFIPVDKDLIPPDLERCQAEQLGGSFMTFGPRPYIRCSEKPVVVAEENERGRDGRKGSMSLCDKCARVLIEKEGVLFATLVPIEEWKKSHGKSSTRPRPSTTRGKRRL